MSDKVREVGHSLSRAAPRNHQGCCFVAPDPRLLARLQDQLDAAVSNDVDDGSVFSTLLTLREPRALGFNDGVVRPPASVSDGASFAEAAAEVAERAPLRGDVNVVVVLVDFEDKPFDGDPKQHFYDLFFASGDGASSVRTFYQEASAGLVNVGGTVVGPYRMPRTLAYYADNASGKSTVVKELARDALVASDADVDFSKYDNDGDGYVDAYVVVHAGRGAEQTGSKGDIWSHKWTLPNGEAYETDGTSVFGYLTVPEDSRLGVCAHELGHLLFGWPDLYDGDYSSSGLGDFCLMAGGSWNGDGDVPCHPSAWCKTTQDWVTVVNHVSAEQVSFEDVTQSRIVHRLWTSGIVTSEYFLIENRRNNGFDRALPGTGLLVYHVDETISGNDSDQHPQVMLLQADGLGELQQRRGLADDGDPFPGSTNNVTLSDATRPSTRGYTGRVSGVSLGAISSDGAIMTAEITV